MVVEGTGEFSPDTKPKASSGEYFLRGWGRSDGFWVVSNPDDGGSDAGAGTDGFLSGELDSGPRVILRGTSPDLIKVEGVSRNAGYGSAFLGGSSRLLNSGMDFWGFGGGSSMVMGVLDSNCCTGSRWKACGLTL